MITIQIRKQLLIIAALSILPTFRSFSQPDSIPQFHKHWLDTLQTLEEYIKEHLSELAPPDYKKQQSVRRTFQQRGYCNILLDLINHDGFGALISFLKTNLHIEYSMTHRTYWIVPPDPRSAFPGIPFPEDRSFSADPWKK